MNNKNEILKQKHTDWCSFSQGKIGGYVCPENEIATNRSPLFGETSESAV
jgi:hypothetical protein